MKRLGLSVTTIALTLLLAVPAQAQLNGSHTPGDYGVQSGSQPAPGFYAALLYLRYDADTIKDADGNIVRLSPGSPGSIAFSAAAPLAWYVSKAKIFGANYGAMAVLPFANASIEAPAFALGQTIGTSVGDLLVRPLDLGWHTARTDVAAGLQIYMPTGQYSPAAVRTSARACGRTSRSSGTTVYFDQQRSLSFAATAYWEINGNKKDTDVKVGQILTLQGGLGKSFLGGGLILGAAYYGQWKLTEDQLFEFQQPGRLPIDAGRSWQASGVRFRSGRDAAGGEPVETVRAGQHPLPVGIRRTAENPGSDAGGHGHFPGAKRKTALSCYMRLRSGWMFKS